MPAAADGSEDTWKVQAFASAREDTGHSLTTLPVVSLRQTMRLPFTGGRVPVTLSCAVPPSGAGLSNWS